MYIDRSSCTALPLFLSGFKETQIFSTDVLETLKYQVQ